MDFKEEQQVLDHGFVVLIDSMGNDESIENAARQSYTQGTRRLNNTRGLIRRLLRDRHDSPFESVDVSVQIKCPIFVARQILRHRLFSVNEASLRFSVAPVEFYVPELTQICYQDKKNKQGRAEPLPIGSAQVVRMWIDSSSKQSFDYYQLMLDDGVSRETARMVLPVNTYTTFVLKGNLRTWLHFLHLRMDSHAQWETVQYANAIARIIQSIAPITYEAWEEYTLHASWLSRTMRRVLSRAVDRNRLLADEEFLVLPESERATLFAALDPQNSP